MTASLFEPYRLGDITLSNRLVMAPLTRNRAGAGLVPTPLMAEYYGQRASAGLIVTEATQVSDTAQGYQDTPGSYTDEQVAGWKRVTEAVHAKGGHIFVQLWHVGRVSHRSFQPGNAAPLAPSAITANTKTFVDGGFAATEAPRALELSEIPGIVDDFRKAAAKALEAGFDGIELHGANGYLIDQFLRNGANQRTDAYGGSIENRTRFLEEVVKAVTSEVGASRTGIRISPVTPANDLSDSDPQPLFERVVDILDANKLVYVHVVEGATGGPRDIVPGFDFEALHKRFRGTWITNNGYDLALAEKVVAEGKADLVAFGKAFLANPDLPARFKTGAGLNPPNQARFYGGGADGYTDYPTLEAVGA